MKVRSSLIIFVILLMISFLISCEDSYESKSAENKKEEVKETYVRPTYTFLLAHTYLEDSFVNSAAVKLKGTLEEKSNGKIGVEIYRNLGSLMETQEAVKNNVVQMQIGTLGSYLTPVFSIFELPNVIPNRQTAREIFTKGTVLRNEVEKEFEKMNLKLLSIAPSSFSVMSSNKPVRTLEDLKNLKVGALENDVAQTCWKLWGSKPVAMDYSKAYLALLQGVIQAQENPLDVIVATKLNEQQKYIIETNHVMFYTAIWINLGFYNKLPKDYKKIIEDSMPEIEEYSYDLSIEYDELARLELKSLGMEFISVPNSELIKMKDAAKESYGMIRKSYGDELIDIYLKSVEEALGK